MASTIRIPVPCCCRCCSSFLCGFLFLAVHSMAKQKCGWLAHPDTTSMRTHNHNTRTAHTQAEHTHTH